METLLFVVVAAVVVAEHKKRMMAKKKRCLLEEHNSPSSITLEAPSSSKAESLEEEEEKTTKGIHPWNANELPSNQTLAFGSHTDDTNSFTPFRTTREANCSLEEGNGGDTWCLTQDDAHKTAECNLREATGKDTLPISSADVEQFLRQKNLTAGVDTEAASYLGGVLSECVNIISVQHVVSFS